MPGGIGSKYSTLAPALAILLVVDAVLAAGLGMRYPLRWLIVVSSASLAFSSISLLVYSRRLLFASASAPHAAFLAASLGLIASSLLGGSILAWTLFFGLLQIYGLGYMVFRGADPDDATSAMVSFASSAGALSLFYVLTRYSYGSDIASIIIGDPLLASRSLTYYSAILGIATVAASFLTVKEIVYIGVDPDDARLSGLRVWFYDMILFTLLALASVGLVTVVGFVMEHALLLLPGAIAVLVCRGGVVRSLVFSMVVGLTAGVVGLYIAVVSNLSPSAIIGLLLVAGYLVTLAYSRR